MKTLHSYIARNLASFAALIVGLVVMNALVFGLFFFDAIAGKTREASPITLLDSVEGASDASGISSEAERELRSRRIWAMFIEAGGDCAWSVDLPEEVPRHYGLQDVARFSKGYIADYPVFVRTTGDGLLVVGYPQDSFMKIISNYIPIWAVRALPAFATTMVVLDVTCLFLVFWFSKRRILSGLEPIADAVEALGTGKAAGPLPKGVLTSLSESVARASELIVKQNEARVDWIAGISHDIRTPLTLIMGNAQIIAQDGSIAPETADRASVISAQSAKIDGLVNDLNLASRLEYDAQPFHMAQSRLAEVIRKTAADAINASKGRDFAIEIEADGAAEGAIVECDERLIGRAMGNVIQNSIVHNPQGCRVRINLSTTDTDARIIIEDDGVGMAARELQALSERQKRSSRVDESLDRRHGLGLQIASRVVRAHGGRISFSSAAGGGFKTTITLPLR
ncbi:sensor histidine kinase [Olsenella massiliensis]|uniref:sensor histidine kinase n=1 Tax=Olsenella massiliensis TaxID=1622075 RepID=UPI00071D637E|nr:HAMP domain-containing sensor histidine kinase [Olsenella massiliensis]